MVLIPVKCPDCQSTDVVKYGKQPNGEQRYRCNHSECDRKTFLLNYTNKGNQPGTKEKIMVLRGFLWSPPSRGLALKK